LALFFFLYSPALSGHVEKVLSREKKKKKEEEENGPQDRCAFFILPSLFAN